VGDFGEEVEVASAVAAEEEEECVDGLAVERSPLYGIFGEDDGDGIKEAAKEKVSCVGNGNAVTEGGGHEIFSIDEKFRNELFVEREAG
jgi:hypothetical protein